MDGIDNTSSVSDDASARRAELAALLRQQASQERATCSLTSGQQSLWFLHLSDPESPAYNTAFAIRIRSSIDVARLRDVFEKIVVRHAALRTTFTQRNGRPEQKIHGFRELSFGQIDASAWSSTELSDRVHEDYRRSFDLEHGPLTRVTLYSRGEDDHVFLWAFHHIICDALSIWVLMSELTELYSAATAGRKAELGPVRHQFHDFVRWQDGMLGGPSGQKQWDYWREKLSGELPKLSLPTDRPHSQAPTGRGASHFFEIDASLMQGLVEIGKSQGATLYMVLLAAIQVLLKRYSGQDDIIVGSPVAGRTNPEFETTVGYFANPLPMRTDLSGDPSFADLLGQVAHTVLEGLTHQDMPLPLLVERLNPQRESGRGPLFEVMFVMQRPPRSEAFQDLLAGASSGPVEWGELKMEAFELAQMEGQFDLTWEFVEGDQSLSGVLKYNPDLFDRSSIERMQGHLRNLLQEVVRDPKQGIGELAIHSDAERQQVVGDWNATARDYPLDRCLHHWVEDEVTRSGDAIALEFEDQRLSWRDLNSRCNQLARELRERGVGPDVPVGISMQRSLEMIVGLLGILKAGGAYVPLDPNEPADRLEFMIGDVGVPLILTQEMFADRLPESAAQVLCLDSDWSLISRHSDENLNVEVDPQDLAYVIFTSGSTGKPKAVANTHIGICNRLLWMQEEYGLDASDHVLQKTPFTFDVSVWEFFWPLMTGARMVIARPDGHKERDYLADLIAEREITTVHFVPSMLRVFLDGVDGQRVGTKLRRVICSGEALAADLQQQFFERIGEDVQLHNLYGPTEAAIDVTHWQCCPDGSKRTVPIGAPIANTQIYILDRQMQPMPIGVPGELHIGGLGLAREYWNRPELTAEKFIADPFSDVPSARLYKTGDLCRWLPDGNIEYLERIDHQVKIRGFRIELGEIEAALTAHPDIGEAVVRADLDSAGTARLVAWIVPQTEEAPVSSELRRYLIQRLPDYMVPSVFTSLKSVPLTSSGKVNDRVLPPPDTSQSDAVQPSTQVTEVEGKITEIWRDVVGVDGVGVHDNFFDIGGHSLLLAQVQTRLTDTFGRAPAMVEMFQYPTISLMGRYFSLDGETSAGLPSPLSGKSVGSSYTPATSRAEIAIVGMSGRFPGAGDVDAFWQNLRDGVESISFFTDEQLLVAGVDPELIKNPNYVKAYGSLDEVDQFDAEFFGFTPLEAETMDVQHRLLLESAWSALEHAAHDPQRDGIRCGVFAGVGLNTYLLNNLYPNRKLVESAGGYQAMLANDKDYAATRISYKLNLRGPSMTVQTACSTSLVALHLACRSLQDGDCEMALAGGCSVNVPQKAGYLYQPDMILSPDGHCRAFDAQAQGTVGGSGVGVVVLRRLEDALRDGDTIHAVIKATAVNNDGGTKAGYTAPSRNGQAAVISEAIESAGVDASSIGYVEAHGTGTVLGDPIEIAALSKSYGNRDADYPPLLIGSVKSNVGHLDAAAGVAGLIKTACALRQQEIPPSLHFQKANPAIDFDSGSLQVNTALQPWTSVSAPRRAGVSSFGIGGTNAHAVLEEAPARNPSDVGRDTQLLLLSAKTVPALDSMGAKLADHLKANPAQNLSDVAFSLACGRREFGYRRFVVCGNLDEAAQGLEGGGEASRALENCPVTFMFSGQGSQYVGMGGDLYRCEPRFRDELDRCAELLQPHLKLDLREILFPDPSSADEARQQLAQTSIAQPALFAFEYSLARLWMSWDVKPVAMIGHSIGEYVAACLAGVFSLEDAMKLVAGRGKLMQQLPSGSMLAVQLAEQQVSDYIDERLSIACINSEEQCVVSGADDAIDELESKLQASAIVCQRLRTSHAFHSSMMEPILASFESLVREVEGSEPKIPFVSNLTGDWIRPEEATDPGYWAQHLRGTVRFADGLRTLSKSGTSAADSVLLEVGPGSTLASLANQHPDRNADRPAVASIRSAHDKQTDISCLLTAAGRLWSAGVPLDGASFYAGQKRQRLPLPTYSFQRRRFWIDPPNASASDDVSPPDLQEHTNKKDLADWFYLPSWKRSLASRDAAAGEEEQWLIVSDGGLLGGALSELIEEAGQAMIAAKPSDAFAEVGPNEFRLDFNNPSDYEKLFARLELEGRFPDRMIYIAQSVQDRNDADCGARRFFELIHLTQALSEYVAERKTEIVVVTSGLHRVAGESLLQPELATLLGPVKIIGREYTNLNSRNVDISTDSAALGPLLAEIGATTSDRIVALRDGHRWVQSFQPIRLKAEDGPRFRHNGTYLITGGLSGIGLEIAEHLALSWQANLVIVSRTSFPAREEWEDCLEKLEESDPIRQRINRFMAMEESGSVFLIIAADVTNREQMAKVRNRGEETFGSIDGVIHAAGIPGGGMIQLKTREAAAEVLAPKVTGTLVLADVFAGPLDFFVLFSSVSSVLEEVGQVDYCAANAFLDAYAECHPAAVCINWDTWQQTGMAVAAELPAELEAQRQERLRAGIRTEEGLEAFDRILASGLRRVVVSTTDFSHRLLADSTTPEPIAEAEQRHSRPQLDVEYTAPDNEIEEGLAEIWSRVLGIEGVGVHDDFFHLGGHSLLAVNVTMQIREAFGVVVPLSAVFEASTISSLAEKVLELQLQEISDKEIERLLAEEEQS